MRWRLCPLFNGEGGFLNPLDSYGEGDAYGYSGDIDVLPCRDRRFQLDDKPCKVGHRVDEKEINRRILLHCGLFIAIRA